jgi:hypothetical protein
MRLALIGKARNVSRLRGSVIPRPHPRPSGGSHVINEIAWHLAASPRPDGIRFELCAVLLQRALIGRTPALKVAANIARIDQGRVDDVDAQVAFWANARRRLGKLTRLRDRDRNAIEDQIALKIPKPMPSAYALTACPAANPIRGPHSPVILRTR